MKKTTWIGVLGLFLLPWLAGCGEEDLTSVRIKLDADQSGTITASSVAVPERTGMDSGMTGVTWTDRVGVTAAAGTFDSLSQLVVGGITFSIDVTAQGMVILEVLVPMGPDIEWAGVFSPMTADQRSESARAFDPEGRIKALGSTFKLHLDLPSEVVATGITPDLTAITSSNEGNEAELLVSLDTALAAQGSLRWHVTWMR